MPLIAAGIGLALAIALPAAPPPDPTPPVWDRVAWCESRGRWDAHPSDYPGAYPFYGGLQFSQVSWEGVGGLHMAPRADLATRAEQVLAARRLLALQGPGAWPYCGPEAGLTRENGGAIAP